MLPKKQNKTKKTHQNTTEPTQPPPFNSMDRIQRDAIAVSAVWEITRKGKICLYFSQGDLLLKPNNEKAVDSTAMCFITDYFTQK